MNKELMSITESAIYHVRLLLKKRSKPSAGIRIGVKSGGCSGLSYYLEYADSKTQFDYVLEVGGISILIDRKALMYVVGSEMDYEDGQFKSGFTFKNPNQKVSCGCGKSFNI